MRDPDFQDDPRFVGRYRNEDWKRSRRRQPSGNIWRFLSRVTEGVIYVLVVLILFKLFAPELKKRHELSVRLEALQEDRARLESKVTEARRAHQRLVSDREYLESVARDRLNLQREGEYVIQIKR